MFTGVEKMFVVHARTFATARVPNACARSFGMSTRGVVVVEDERDGDSGRAEALAEVANQPIATHVLNALRSSGVEEIVVVTSDARGEVADCVGEHCHGSGLRLRHVTQRDPVDLSAALTLLQPIVGGSSLALSTAPTAC